MELGFDEDCEERWGGSRVGKQMDLNSAHEVSSYDGMF